MMRAPREILCTSMDAAFIRTKTTQSTRGMEQATTMPARFPRLKKETPRTMATARSRVSTNSPMESRTTAGWLKTWISSMPAGSSARSRSAAASSRLPSWSTLPPSRMEISTPSTGSPL